MGEEGRGLAVAKAGTGLLLNLPEMYQNELNCTHLPLNSGGFLKNIFGTEVLAYGHQRRRDWEGHFGCSR